MAPPISQYALAADIGGTNMRAALVDSEGHITGRGSIDTLPESGIDDASARLARLLEAARATAPTGAEIAGVGVSTAGPIRPATGTYNHPPNLTGWHGKTMKPSLSGSLGIPVWVGHDATLAALAETRFGDHVGAENLIYVTISTGIGGGIIANSEMVTGASGGAGEIGHTSVRTGAYRCNVGCDGCFEGNASGPAIARAARDRFRNEGPLAELAGGDPANITSRMVFDAAHDGDPVAREVVDLTIENVGIGLGGLLNTFDPEALVIGGGVVQGLQRHWDELKASIVEHALPRYENGVPLTATRLGDDVSLLGAAQLAFRESRRL
ncbi:MAG: ROK family protein [Dehalococcoidia bacterium]|jgi:glucokinase|nr:ROK family protein [Dehalococcoidia bacterium]